MAIVPGPFLMKNGSRGYPESFLVPCGNCIMCKVARAKEWALRCVHEAQYHGAATFITLTYNSLFLPPDLGLHKRELQYYFKRLRKLVDPIRIKYLACGEYGNVENVPDGSGAIPQDENYWSYYARGYARPHYHAIVFGVSIDEHERRPLERGKLEKGYKLLKGPLVDAWKATGSFNSSLGFVSAGTVTFDSARYCVAYLFKSYDKIYSRKIYKDIQQPFLLTSKGIGFRYADENRQKILERMSCTWKGEEVGIPRYYQKKLLDSEELRNERREKAGEKEEERREYWRKHGVPDSEIFQKIKSARVQRARELMALQKLKSIKL